MDLGVARDQETCTEAVGGGTKAYGRHLGAVVTTRPAHRSTPQPRSPSRDTGDGAHSTLSPQRSTQGGRDGQHGPSYRKLRPESGK